MINITILVTNSSTLNVFQPQIINFLWCSSTDTGNRLYVMTATLMINIQDNLDISKNKVLFKPQEKLVYLF